MATQKTQRSEASLKDNGTLVHVFWDAVNHGAPRLQSIPGLVKKILETEAWRKRIYQGRAYEHETFLSFLTTKPLAGCGFDPDQIEALIEHDDDTLAMWRKATVGAKHVHADGYNRTIKPVRGTAKAYTLTRLKQETPALYQAVCAGELSANAAAIEAGFRKKPTPFEQVKKLIRKLSPEERRQLRTLLEEAS